MLRKGCESLKLHQLKSHMYSIAQYPSKKLGFLSRAHRFFLIFSATNDITILKISFSRVLVPDLAWCSKNLLLNFSTKFCPSYCLVTIPTSPNPSNLFFSASFSSRTFHILQILSPELLSGDQGYYSNSLEACQDHQKLNSITSFPCFTAYFTNSIP